jgi:hypothetical protein
MIPRTERTESFQMDQQPPKPECEQRRYRKPKGKCPDDVMAIRFA